MNLKTTNKICMDFVFIFHTGMYVTSPAAHFTIRHKLHIVFRKYINGKSNIKRRNGGNMKKLRNIGR